MLFNVLKGALWEINTVEGNKDLDFVSQLGLVDYGDMPMTSLVDDDVLVVDFDFGYRLHLNRIEYKYSSPYANSQSIASGIEFYYKDEFFDDYMSLETYTSAPDIFYTTISGADFAPRYIRFKHTVSNTQNTTTYSGSVYGFKAFNNETFVDFGTDGTKTQENIEAVREGIPDVRAIAIYNSGTRQADAYVNLDPSQTSMDQALAISASPDGPWTYAFNVDDVIADESNFNEGIYELTDTNTLSLRLTGIDLSAGHYVTENTYGSYTTNVVSRGNSDYCRFVIDKASGYAGHVAVDKGDPVDTVEIRSSNAPPGPYAVLREFVNTFANSYYYYFTYRDRWIGSGDVKENGSQLFFPAERYSRYTEYNITVDQKTERYAGVAQHHYASDSRSTADLYLFVNFGTDHRYIRLAYQSTSQTRINYDWLETKLDYSGGMWVRFFCSSYHSGDFVNNKGYYLCYFDPELVNKFKWWTTANNIGALDINYDTKQLWYTRQDDAAIYKINTNGDIEIDWSEPDYSYDLGGIAVLPSGNLIFANDKDLHRLSSAGIYMPEYFLEGVAGDKLSYIVLDEDGSEAIWAIDGQSVGRLFLYGEYAGKWDFKVDVPLPIRMDAVEGGVWVRSVGESGDSGILMRFISKANKRIDFTYEPSSRCQPGIIYQTTKHPNYTKKMPIATDTIWSALPWKKANIEGFLSNEDRYYQLRLTLRRQEPIERYPEFVIDKDQDFFNSDNFEQSSSTPFQLLWGDWRDRPALDRVYVDTTEHKLALINDVGGTLNAFISTKDRLVVSRDADGIIDVRVKFKFGEGDGIESGVSENIYIYLFSVDENFEGKYMATRFLLATPSTTGTSRIYSAFNDNWSPYNFNANSGYYEGELRLYWNGSVVYGHVRSSDTAGWVTDGANCTPSVVGNNFYVQIVGDRNSSSLKLDYFLVYQARSFYYSDTPRIYSVNKQQLIKIPAIAPNSSKNVYLRTYVPKDLEIEAQYNMDMNVRWRVPVY